MDYMKRALELKESLVRDRRFLHQHPEIRNDLPITASFVEERLKALGLDVRRCGGSGLTATIGGKKPGPVLLLRADMDALPMQEESGLEFASLTPGQAHCCGHDTHTAMLLCAAQMLKENEDALEGTVKLMFQPDEEGGNGCLDMVNDGILENPKVDAALALHVDAAAPLGSFAYGLGPIFSSNDVFSIKVIGKAGHGARPHQSIDPINAAAHILVGLETLIAREANPSETCMLCVGSIESSSKAFNIIPESVLMKGSIRTYNHDQREMLVRRLKEVAEYTAMAFACRAEVQYEVQMPPLIVNDNLELEMRKYLDEVLAGFGGVVEPPICKMGSEDFTHVTNRVPSAFFFIGAGPDREHGGQYSQHNTKVVFNEEMLPMGAAGYAYCAEKWLANHAASK